MTSRGIARGPSTVRLGVEAGAQAVVVRCRAADDAVAPFDLGDRVEIVDGGAIQHLRERLDRVAEPLRVRAVRRVPDSDQRRPIHVGAQLDEPARDWRVEAHRLAPLIANDNLLPVNDLGHHAVCPERVAELRGGVEREKRQLVERKAHGRHDVEAVETAVAVYRAVAFEALLLDTHIFRVDRRVNREPGQQAIWPGQV